MSPDQFKGGMRRLAAGVSLITTANRGQRHGLVATAVSSLTVEPPTLLVCVNRNASAHDHIADSRILCVNLLSESQQPTADRFSSSADRDRRFEFGVWEKLSTGAPALVGSLTSFDCEVRQVMAYHTHSVFIAEVVEVELWAEKAGPLVYLDGRYRIFDQAQLHS